MGKNKQMLQLLHKPIKTCFENIDSVLIDYLFSNFDYLFVEEQIEILENI